MMQHRRRQRVDLVVPDGPLVPLLAASRIGAELNLLARGVAGGNDDNVARQQVAVGDCASGIGRRL